ncbi:MarR family winged helix-turn-helix transcriptional regulator [Blastococcus xanthinilyticus]|uniref:DNA-binding MarR family transcriptional regulator n=1 Tax=Blastococcus xanthinilyticus TaxID=1564164 RepID=A0A5S5CW55_9ACTN|nr:MarR family transcriptional regulator [Blastococcus xanthinilyticus]TYP87835.1 DNA-binding MarR family transcriptional regulator [Blastococcus xanthinilyticus]
MPSPPPEPTRDSGLLTLSDQMPRFMRLIHGIKAQHTAEGGRDRAASVLLFPLERLGPLRQSALAELVHADPSTVSRHVTLLVEHGLVVRVADESDGRASRLVLTDAGRTELDGLRAERVAYLRTVVTEWTDDELTTFTALFDRLLDGIAATLPNDQNPSSSRTVSA